MVKSPLFSGIVFCFVMAAGGALSADTTPAKSIAVLVTGLSGSRQFHTYFQDSVNKLVPVLKASGYSVIYRFSEAPGNSEQGEAANREVLEKRLSELASEGPYENVFVWVAGHANGRDEESMLHLPKQDVSYKDLMGWLNQIESKRSVYALAVPQGQAWVKALAKPGRVIAAGSGLREYDFIPWMFLRHFPASFKSTARIAEGESAGTLTSLKDVFVEAQKKSQAWYRDNHLQPTELAYLDADGDGFGETLFDPAMLPEPEEPSLEEAQPLAASPERSKMKAKAVDLSSLDSRILDEDDKSVKIGTQSVDDGTLLAPHKEAPAVLQAKINDFETLPDSREADEVLFTISRGGERHES